MACGEAHLWSIYWRGTRTGRQCRYAVVEWVLRPRGLTVQGGPEVRAASYRQARGLLPAGVALRIGREESDDPALVESWV